MKIRFLQDYRGKLTGERYFLAGAEAEFADDNARAMLDRGVAEEVSAEPVEDAPKKPTRRKRTSK